MQTNIIDKEEYVKGISRGVKIIADLIKPTYGGKGKNVIVESHLRPYHQIVNDCETIIQSVKITGKSEKIGANFLKEISSQQDKLMGNGRKTTILMTNKLLELGNAYKGDKNELKRELDALISFIEAEIDLQTTLITENEVESVATTASENKETGELLREIYFKIGKSGIIQPEGSGTFETSYRFIDGVRFDMTGFLSPVFANENSKAVYEKPLILITKKKITTDDEINPLLTEFIQMEDRRPLIIFTQDMDSGIASMLVDLHKSKRLEICIIKAPTLWQDYVFQDFAKCVGATIIEDATGLNLKKIPLSALGTCDKITVDTDETILIGTKDISEHIAQLQSKGDDDSKLRLSWLTNKTAILKLGANSETDLSLKRLKCHDAIRSSELALKYGIVKGGGLCLNKVADTLPDTIAGAILKEVLKTPYDINLENGVKEIPENVVDASMVIKKAVRHAVGIASTILTASALVYLPEEPIIKEQQAFQ